MADTADAHEVHCLGPTMGTSVACDAEITPKDLQALAHHCMLRAGLALNLLGLLTLGLLLAAYGLAVNTDAAEAAYMILAALIVAGVRSAMVGRTVRRAYVGPQHVSVGSGLVSIESQEASCSHSWAGFQKLGESKNHFFLMVSPLSAYVLPKRGFDSPEHADAFRRLAKQQLAR